MKKVNVKVYDRTELRKLASEPFEEKTAVISIRDSDAPDISLQHEPDFMLRLSFDDAYSSDFDADDNMLFINFSENQAQEIAEFVMSCKNKVRIIICQCEMGQSRSAAVAAVISEYLNGDGIRFFADGRYSPNLYVFQMLYRVLKKAGI